MLRVENQPATYRLGFRRDIEGLRAVAIVLVVLCHARFPGFGAGFIGVDIFFVISGYLITGLLLNEYHRNGNIALGAFYLRRLKRLAPALLLMILICSGLVFYGMSPADQSRHFLAAASASTWLSNFHFFFSNTDYFGPSAQDNIFIHTWSLAVEEQFYLLWPAFILAGTSSKLSFRGVFIAVGLISFATCLYLSNTNLTAAYYLPWARAWQFTAGAAAVLLTFHRCGQYSIELPPHEALHRVQHWCLWLAAAAIALAVALIQEGGSYPGWQALLPTIGTAAILALGHQQHALTRLLSLAPLTGLGKVSYSWYLWHWPLIYIETSLYSSTSNAIPWISVGASLAIAVLSYSLVETPLRRARLTRGKLSIFAISCGTATLSLVLLQFWLLQYSQQKIDSPALARALAARHDTPIVYSRDCDDWIHSSELKLCEFGDENAAQTMWLIGDSISAQWFSAFELLLEHGQWQIVVATKSSCPLVDEPYIYSRIGRRFRNCEIWRGNLLANIGKQKPDWVVLSSSYKYPFTARQWQQGTSRVLAQIAPVVDSVSILRSTPSLPFDGPNCLGTQDWQRQWQLPLPEPLCTASPHEATSHQVFAALQLAAENFVNVQALDMSDLVCPDNLCRAELKDTVVFRDTHHLSDSFARTIAPELLNTLNRIGTMENLQQSSPTHVPE
jgi:peptidoglycan/LPS O-acetylase OafA/YrhL